MATNLRRRAPMPSTGLSLSKWLHYHFLSISKDEAAFDRRGFGLCDLATQRRLETIGETFLYGYNAALVEDDVFSLQTCLDSVTDELRGFAYEGAAMGVTLLDQLSPFRQRRLDDLLAGPGAPHRFMVHVGAGWALARLPLRITRFQERRDALLRWLIFDGYGFHEGYFHWPKSINGQQVPARITGYARRAFDQGLGRSLWFVAGSDLLRIARTIASFSTSRHGDLWSGVGLACAYAGSLDDRNLEALRAAATGHLEELAQGAAFAAKARLTAGHCPPHTERACRVLCDLSAADAAHLTDRALISLADRGATPKYEVWRQRIQANFRKPSVRKPFLQPSDVRH